MIESYSSFLDLIIQLQVVNPAIRLAPFHYQPALVALLLLLAE
jgi:hypothetical protein